MIPATATAMLDTLLERTRAAIKAAKLERLLPTLDHIERTQRTQLLQMVEDTFASHIKSAAPPRETKRRRGRAARPASGPLLSLEMIEAAVRAHGMELVVVDLGGSSRWVVASHQWIGGKGWGSNRGWSDKPGVGVKGAWIYKHGIELANLSIRLRPGGLMSVEIYPSGLDPALKQLEIFNIETEEDLNRHLGLMEEVFDELTLKERPKGSAWLSSRHRRAIEGAAKRTVKRNRSKSRQKEAP